MYVVAIQKTVDSTGRLMHSTRRMKASEIDDIGYSINPSATRTGHASVAARVSKENERS